MPDSCVWINSTTSKSSTATILSHITFADVLLKNETITLGTGQTAGNRFSGSSLENLSYVFTKPLTDIVSATEFFMTLDYSDYVEEILDNIEIE